MTLAKAVCGGIAGGAHADHARNRPQPAARHARRHVRRQPDRRPGRHRRLEMIEHENLLEHAQQLSSLFRAGSRRCRQECDLIREVRVLGVMIGVELTDRRQRRSSRPAWTASC